MTSSELARPLVLKEDARTEFKAAAALEDPALIARAVVAFLNAGGGNVWIGIREGNGEIALERVPSADKARTSLLNHLLDTIEPALRPGDIDVRVTAVDLIHLHIKDRRPQGPYAQLVKRGRWYGIRVDDRVREMTYGEIEKAYNSRNKNDDREQKTIDRIQSEQAKVIKKGRGLWLRMEPTEELSINFEDQATRAEFTRWLTERGATGNLPSPWSYVVPHPYGELEFPEGTVCRLKLADLKVLEITNKGRLTFTITLDKLIRPHGDERVRTLSPYAIMAFPTSVLRLVSKILARHATETEDLKIVTAMTIGGLGDSRLYPGSPKDPFYGEIEDAKKSPADVLERSEPFIFGKRDVTDEPDRCSLRLVRWVYEGFFGFGSGDIPPEFDQTRGQLVLP